MINHVIPSSTEDLFVNKSVLLENNFDQINAIDWNKGCYVGQEITARMKYRSLLKKSLRSFSIDSGKVILGDQIFFNNYNIGEIKSIVDNIGLAMIKTSEANEAVKNKKTLKTLKGTIKITN